MYEEEFPIRLAKLRTVIENLKQLNPKQFESISSIIEDLIHTK